MGSGTEIRQRQTAILAAQMKRDGYSLSDIAAATGVRKDRLQSCIERGARLLTLDDPLRRTQSK